MKRKFKLFATIASLCLCLALMAFGVYAATNVKYTASGSVSFTVNDVFVTVTNSCEQTIKGTKTAVAIDGEGTLKTNVKSYTEDGGVKAPTDAFDANNQFKAAEFKATGDKLVFTTTITNDGETAIRVKFDLKAPTDSHLDVSAKYNVAEDQAITLAEGAGSVADMELASKATITVTLTITLKSMESTVNANNTWSVTGYAANTESDYAA